MPEAILRPSARNPQPRTMNPLVGCTLTALLLAVHALVRIFFVSVAGRSRRERYVASRRNRVGRTGGRRRRPRCAAHASHGRHATDGDVQEGNGADLGRRVRGCHGRLPGGRREEHADRNRVRHQRADGGVSVGGLFGLVHRLADRRPYRRQARPPQGVPVQPAAVRPCASSWAWAWARSW